MHLTLTCFSTLLFASLIPKTNSQCTGSPLTLTNPTGTAKTDFDFRGEYYPNQDCKWVIDTNEEVEITLNDMNIEEDGCSYDWLEIIFAFGGNTQAKYCGEIGSLRETVFTGNGPVEIIFISDGSVQTGVGFDLSYEILAAAPPTPAPTPPPDPCEPNPCGPGTCVYFFGRVNCNCGDTGYSGANCEIEPTTAAPVTEPPETDPPETDPPETDPPETDPPETDPPETDPPETDSPETDPPETNPPETDPTETDSPETDPPETDPPETDPPETDPPETDPPETDPPETDSPETNPPETDPPETDPPETDPPETDPPETDPPETDPPVIDPCDPNPCYQDPSVTCISNSQNEAICICPPNRSGPTCSIIIGCYSQFLNYTFNLGQEIKFNCSEMAENLILSDFDAEVVFCLEDGNFDKEIPSCVVNTTSSTGQGESYTNPWQKITSKTYLKVTLAISIISLTSLISILIYAFILAPWNNNFLAQNLQKLTKKSFEIKITDENSVKIGKSNSPSSRKSVKSRNTIDRLTVGTDI